jgi:hypothetical protein
LITKCVAEAKNLPECCAFAINRDFGVHFYKAKCYELDVDEAKEWVTYELANVTPIPPPPPAKFIKVTELI